MRQYRFYYLDKRNHIIVGRDIECESDEKALAQAALLSQTHTIEIWCGTRLIGSQQKKGGFARAQMGG